MVKDSCIWKFLPMVLICLLIRGDCKEECMSALKLQAVGNTEFDLKDKALKTREKCIQDAIDGWILQMNDTEAGISLNYPVKCQQGCQHCNNESLRPHPPQEIAYTSTTGSNLCFRWKGSVSTNYTMYYTQNRGYCSDTSIRCTADRLENEVLECCPQNLHLVAPIYVRIDYENKYMYVYGILYWLRAQTIAIPNPLKKFTYQLLDDTTVEFMFEDPEDWNFYSFSLLDKRICQKSPPVEEGAECKTKTFQYPPNTWTISGLSYGTQYIYTAQCYRIEGRWSEEKNITFRTGGNGDCKGQCMSALKLQAVGNTEFDLKEKTLKAREQCIQNAIDTSWILQVNDTEAGISLNYAVKCQQGCQHWNNESLRPYPPQEIAYTSTTGSNLCFRWKGSVSTNYTMYYTQNRGYCSDMNTRCTADRLENEVLECCPQNLHPVAPIYVRIDYENKYMYVYGILYWLRAQTIAIPNPLKTFTYQLLDDTTVKFIFEDPEDWNFYSFSLLDKRICQKSPLVEEVAECKTKTFQYPPNTWTISGLSYDTQYIYTAQCYRIEGRWSEEKSITFHTGRNGDSSNTPGPPFSTEMSITSTSTAVAMFASTQNQTVQNQSDNQAEPDQNKVPLYAKGLMILAGFLIAAAIVILLGACRCVHKRLFWKIPEPNVPPVIEYHCVDSKVPEVFDELRTRNEKLSISWNNGVDSGQGTSEGTLDESGFIDQYTPSQPLNGHVSVDHMHTHQVFIHKNSDDSDEDCMGSNPGNGVGIGEVSFQNLIYENNVLVNENMGRKLGEYVNDDNSNSDDDDGDDSGDYGDDSAC